MEIVEYLFDEFIERYQIQPTTTDGGLFDSFLQIIFADPALKRKGFAVSDTRRLIKREAKGRPRLS